MIRFVGDALDLFHLVRAIDHRAVVGGIAVQQRFQERALGDHVQAKRRFVQHQQFRPLRERQREVEAGAFAARQLPDLLLRQHVVVADHAVERLLVPARVLVFLHRRHLGDAHPVRQRVFLVDEADPAAVLRGQRLAVATEDAGLAGGLWHEAHQDPEQGGLAGAVGADDGVDAPARDAQVEVVQGQLAAVALAQRAGLDDVVGVVAHVCARCGSIALRRSFGEPVVEIPGRRAPAPRQAGSPAGSRR